VTTPQQPPQQPPPSQAGQLAEVALVTAVGTALLSAPTVPLAMAGLSAGVLASLRIPRQAMAAALKITMDFPPGLTGAYGAATITSERTNNLRRSQFVISAAKRIGADIIAARSRNQSISAALGASVQRERRFYAQHLMATWQRSQAGAQVDSAAMTYGSLLGWHAADRHASPECLAADGKNFYADHMPLIGYPGAVHPHCRCQAGSPFPGARLLPSYGLPSARGYRRAA
jgi:hypothetical protein